MLCDIRLSTTSLPGSEAQPAQATPNLPTAGRGRQGEKDLITG